MKKRDWSAMRAKCDAEGKCRYCHGPDPQAAHIVPRSLIPAGLGGEDALNCVPLCDSRGCHSKYDRHELDLLPLLSRDEQAHAASLIGLLPALKLLTGREWVPVAPRD